MIIPSRRRERECKVETHGGYVPDRTNGSSRWRSGEGNALRDDNGWEFPRLPHDFRQKRTRTTNPTPQTTLKMDISVRNNHFVTPKADQRHTRGYVRVRKITKL